jgi:hypothetical protein
MSPEEVRIVSLGAFAVLTILGCIRPVYLVAAYMVLVYCKLSVYYGFLASIKAELLFAILFLVRAAIGTKIGEFKKTSSWKIHNLIILLTISLFVSYFFAWDRAFSWEIAVYHYIKSLVLYVLILLSLSDKRDFSAFIWMFVGMFAFLAYEPAYYYITGSGGSEQWYGTNYIADIGILSGHVALANNMNQMIPIVVCLIIGSNTMRARVFGILCLSVFIVALIGSGSRGGIVGMLVWSTLILFMLRKSKKVILFLFPLIVALVIMFSGAVMHTASRIDSRSAEGRLIGLTHGIGMLLKGNVLGVGPGCYLLARERYFSYRMESHNLYGQILGDLGLPGLIISFLLAVQVFRTIREIKQREVYRDQFVYYAVIGVQISLITRMVVSMASHGLYYFYWYVMAAVIICAGKLSETAK